MKEKEINEKRLKEKLDAVYYFLYSFYPQTKDPAIIKSTLEDLIEIFKEIVDYKLIMLKKEGKIKIFPKEFSNKGILLLQFLQEKMDKKEIEVYNTLLTLVEDKFYLKRYSNLEDVENFYKLVKKIYEW